jgi:hypothetical protein
MSFIYSAILDLSDDMYREHPFKYLMQTQKMNICSQSFSEYSECLTKAHNFCEYLADQLDESVNAKHHCMGWIINPILDTKEVSRSASNVNWEPGEMLKMFVFVGEDNTSTLVNIQSDITTVVLTIKRIEPDPANKKLN